MKYCVFLVKPVQGILISTTFKFNFFVFDKGKVF